MNCPNNDITNEDAWKKLCDSSKKSPFLGRAVTKWSVFKDKHAHIKISAFPGYLIIASIFSFYMNFVAVVLAFAEYYSSSDLFLLPLLVFPIGGLLFFLLLFPCRSKIDWSKNDPIIHFYRRAFFRCYRIRMNAKDLQARIVQDKKKYAIILSHKNHPDQEFILIESLLLKFLEKPYQVLSEKICCTPVEELQLTTLPPSLFEKLKVSNWIALLLSLLLAVHFLISVIIWIGMSIASFVYLRVGIDWPMFVHFIPAMFFLVTSIFAVIYSFKHVKKAILFVMITMLLSVGCFLFDTKKQFYQDYPDTYWTWWWHPLHKTKFEWEKYKETYYKYGYIDKTGRFVIEPRFDSAGPFSEGLACVGFSKKAETEREKKRAQPLLPIPGMCEEPSDTVLYYGFIDKAGRLVIDPNLEYAGDFSDGMARISRDGKAGYINTKGEIVIELQDPYNTKDFCEGFAVVYTEDEYVFLDKEGRNAFGRSFRWANSFHEGLAPVRIENKCGYIDPTGQVVIEPQFDSASQFNKGFATVRIDDKYGILDKTGQFVIAPQFDWMTYIQSGLAPFMVRSYRGCIEKWGVVDTQGHIVIEPEYSAVLALPDDILYVCMEKGWGYRHTWTWRRVTREGKVMEIPYNDRVLRFSENLAPILIDDQYGYINPEGEMIIPPQFDDAESFFEGAAIIEINHQYGYINKEGEILIEPQFDTTDSFSEGLACVGFEVKAAVSDPNTTEHSP